MAQPALIDRLYAEVMVTCEAELCNATFVSAQPALDPMETWSEQAATEAEAEGWTISSGGLVLCPLHSPVGS